MMIELTRAEQGTLKPYGLWPSPLTPRILAGGIRLYDAMWDSDGKTLVWLEHRDGKSVLVAQDVTSGDAPVDLTADIAIRARVGYGGGDFGVGNGMVVFVEKSGRLYRQPIGAGQPQPVTPSFGSAAAPAIAPDGRYVLFIHTYEDTDVLAIVDSAGHLWPQRIASGHDFYMQPCWHPNAQRIAYIAWDHPRMPWEGSLLYLADLRMDANDPQRLPTIANPMLLAGNAKTAIFQPSFSPDGRWLAYISDETGWGQVYLYDR
ncbi:MAG: hypothetical protein HC876_21600 [Chloroflexaceae bacterium]|nr:hypothetical protein [Chloroflexaceae bacterium]